MLIAFEGCEGCGKSTQLKLTAEWLRTEHPEIPIVVTREPGGTELGKQIRELLLHYKGAIAPQAELLLFQADREQHWAEVITPALERGDVVLCDRSIYSTIAYQVAGRAKEDGVIASLRQWADFEPDHTIWLDVPVRHGLWRAGRDRIESEHLEFHQRVYKAYYKLIWLADKDFCRVDGVDTIDEVFDRVKVKMRRFLNLS